MRAVRRDRSVALRTLLGLGLLAAFGVALLVLPLPTILAHAAPTFSHVVVASPAHH